MHPFQTSFIELTMYIIRSYELCLSLQNQ